MKKAAGVILLLLLAATLMGQNRSGFVGTPGVFRGFPGGAMPGVQRFTGSVVNPGAPSRNSPQIGIPRVPLQPPNFSSSRPFRINPANRGFGRGFGRTGGGSFGFDKGFGRSDGAVFAYPVYVGGYGDFNGGDYPPPAPAPESNVFVVYPPPAAPVIINHYGNGEARSTQPNTRIFELPERQAAVEEPAEPGHFLIAFRDKSVYAALGYWVESETLHYITTGNTHNSASIALVDRDLTAKLNKDSGREVKLPPAR